MAAASGGLAQARSRHLAVNRLDLVTQRKQLILTRLDSACLFLTFIIQFGVDPALFPSAPASPIRTAAQADLITFNLPFISTTSLKV